MEGTLNKLFITVIPARTTSNKTPPMAMAHRSLLGSMFFVIVDAYSKWLEVIEMSSTTAGKTVSDRYWYRIMDPNSRQQNSQTSC